MTRCATRLPAALLAVIALVITGCSGDDGATTSDGDTTTTVGSGSPDDATTTTTATPSVDGDLELRPYELLDLTRPDDPEQVPLADPAVIRIDDTWYLYGTTSGEGFEMWSSTDLSSWEYGGVVWEPTPGSWNDGEGQGGYWAPDLHVNENGIWLYYTSQVRIGVAKADTPAGPFVDQLDHPLVGNGHGGVGDGELPDSEESIVGNWDDRAWDAWLHEADDGSMYLYFSAMTPFSEMRVIPLVDEVTTAEVAPTVVVEAEGHLETWEGWVREGPAVVEHEGVIHLMYSGNAWSNVCYAVGVSTATDPLGPFERVDHNPILATDADTGFYAPGHNSVIEGPDGEILAFFHVKVDDGLFGDRRSTYAPLDFDAGGNLQFVDAPSTTPPNTPLCLEPTL